MTDNSSARCNSSAFSSASAAGASSAANACAHALAQPRRLTRRLPVDANQRADGLLAADQRQRDHRQRADRAGQPPVPPQVGAVKVLAAVHHPAANGLDDAGQRGRQRPARQQRQLAVRARRHQPPARRRQPVGRPVDEQLRHHLRIERLVRGRDQFGKRRTPPQTGGQRPLAGKKAGGKVGRCVRSSGTASSQTWAAYGALALARQPAGSSVTSLPEARACSRPLSASVQ